MNTATMPRHTIATVALRTGIGQDQLRTWERRLGLLTPGRSQGGRRLYCDDDVAHLLLVKAALERGLRIGDVARMDREGLRALLGGSPQAESPGSASGPDTPGGDPAAHLSSCLGRVQACDAPGLAEELGRASVELSLPRLLEGLVLPLLCEVGDGWREGRLRIGQEHLATVAVRGLLERLRAARRADAGAPRLLTGTLSGQRHELGAMMAALWAAESGWETIHAGADLPAEELALLAKRVRATVLAISLTLPVDPGLANELVRLRELLPGEVVVVAGGPALAVLPPSARACVSELASLELLPAFLAKVQA
jgi:methylmalonyl-CoA mutase cobalamin-binding subunit